MPCEDIAVSSLLDILHFGVCILLHLISHLILHLISPIPRGIIFTPWGKIPFYMPSVKGI